MKDSLGDRMKENYENRYRMKLTRRTPVILRLDGKAFHTLTRKCKKPFDGDFSWCMNMAAEGLCEQIQGVKIAYIQSDEISLLLSDYDTLTTEAWFDYNIQKMVSVSASIASTRFTDFFNESYEGIGIFDSRAFNIPVEEVANYFIWRQKDWIRNSVQMLAQSLYSHKELNKKTQADMHDMIYDKGLNWADLDDKWKNGSIITREEEGWKIKPAPIFKYEEFTSLYEREKNNECI
jgi:tRNA(His) 5'-end guanylyltransferase